MITSRKLSDLDPRTAIKARDFQLECAHQGIDVIFTSTLRDFEAQDVLYAQGRTTPGKIVTNAKGGDSFHNYAMAFDFVPLVNGKAVWDDEELFTRCGEIAESVGLEWAGRWNSFKEMAHCQYTGGMTLAQLKTRHENGLDKNNTQSA